MRSNIHWFSLPNKCDVLIFNLAGYAKLKPYLDGYKCTVFSSEREEIYLLCLIRSLFLSIFWRGDFMGAYYSAFVKSSLPKIVITFIDNNPDYYRISALNKDIKTVFVQNGWRDKFLEIVPLPPSPFVDHMCVYNDLIGQYYTKHIGGQYHVIGSVPNNHVITSKKLPDNSVLFISQYRDRPKTGSDYFYTDAFGRKVLYSIFYYPESVVLPLLSRWCQDNQRELVVAGSSITSFDDEKAFFDRYIKGEWSFMKKENELSSYEIIDSAEIIVTVDSNLGYEAFVRGKKTAFVTCRNNDLDVDDMGFCWHAGFSDSGLFWTNSCEENKILMILNYLAMVKDEEWNQLVRKYADDVMIYDPGNTRFKLLLDQLLQKSDDLS
ncbi:LA_1612 family putative O-antigen biosynthesis protein [Candidatus Chlorobium masyuteum]|uniref:LA_1612 family putative O-antigen biosynthesis protein n=1 Tax=Candidatus Chlorobium masyuteum TaxID=2716876 RepID=UPI001F2FC2BC|nr:LA_1612 family putative O-antigen biosynthesis protein [Candidatus Chlorobium masyuteum]